MGNGEREQKEKKKRCFKGSYRKENKEKENNIALTENTFSSWDSYFFFFMKQRASYRLKSPQGPMGRFTGARVTYTQILSLQTFAYATS